MPESGRVVQAVECLADIRKFGGASSGIMVFDSEQPGATTAHAARYDSFNSPESNSPQKRITRRAVVRGVLNRVQARAI